jgi:mono/diheme cytochrome c family protein
MDIGTSRWLALILVALTLWGCGEAWNPTNNVSDRVPASQALINPKQAGASDYGSQCLSCHGAQGLGQEALQAPALTSLDPV